MATALTPFESPSVPSFLKEAGKINSDLTGGVGIGFKVISIKGKVFTIVSGGERNIVMKPGEDDEVATSLEVVLVRANSSLSKVFYKTGYEEGSTAKPDCFSNDGKKPDASVENPVNATCANCPKNAWGSGGKGNTKACSDSRRIAVSPAGQLNDPMLLRVPPASLKPLAEFSDVCNKRGAPYNSVICKLKFEREESTPKLIFQPIAFLDAPRYAEVVKLADSDIVRQILGAETFESRAGEVADKVKDAGQAEPAPLNLGKKAEKPKVEAKVEKAAKVEAKVEAPAGEGGLLDELNDLLGKSDD